MKTSKKILLATAGFIFIMLFAMFFNLKAEISKFEINETANTPLADFKHIVYNSDKFLYLSSSDKNEVNSDSDTKEFTIKNDTLYINTNRDLSINFKNLESIISKNGGVIRLQNIITKDLKVELYNNSELSIQETEIDNLDILTENNSEVKVFSNAKNISAKIKNNSDMRVYNSDLESISVKCDTSSNFNVY